MGKVDALFLCGDSTKPIDLTYNEARKICDARQEIVDEKILKSINDMEEALKRFNHCHSFDGQRGCIVRMEAIGNTLTNLLEERASIPIPKHSDWDWD